MDYPWNFASVFANSDALLVGAIGTLRIFLICLVSGLSLGLFVGLARYSTRRALYIPASAFVEFFRNTPVLVQILWFYFALPMLVPFEISPLMAASLGISLNSAAFSAEIYRGGMTTAQAMRRIVLPQALKRMLPAMTNRGIEIFKMSTLASAVSYAEMLQQGKLIASLDYNPIEVYTVIALAFFVFLFPLVQATYALERKLRRSD
jgi:polar amino acid transport system permease protein